MTRLEQLQSLLADSPQDSFLLFAVAKEFESQGDDERARAHYEQLRQADPDYIGLYYHLGKLLERQKDPAGAIDVYRDGIDRARNAGDLHAMSELAGAKLALTDEDEEDDEDEY
jgi:tetratricopeptide (TPR) repeat protein